MTKSEVKKAIRDYHTWIHYYNKLDNPESLMEKEYHFDEGCGLSLSDHVNNLKAEYPNAKVETRRDRDGFAIVKISHEREFKYNLDQIIEFDQAKENEKAAETLEIILKSTLPEG